MLRIYSFIVDTLKLLGPVLREIARHDPDLARQGKRAASSIALNAAEGHGNTQGNRRLRYETALGSTREVSACLDVEARADLVGFAESGAVAKPLVAAGLPEALGGVEGDGARRPVRIRIRKRSPASASVTES